MNSPHPSGTCNIEEKIWNTQAYKYWKLRAYKNINVDRHVNPMHSFFINAWFHALQWEGPEIRNKRIQITILSWKQNIVLDLRHRMQYQVLRRMHLKNNEETERTNLKAIFYLISKIFFLLVKLTFLRSSNSISYCPQTQQEFHICHISQFNLKFFISTGAAGWWNS